MSKQTIDYADVEAARSMVRHYGDNPDAVTESDLTEVRRVVPGVTLAGIRKNLRRDIALLKQYEADNADITDQQVYTLADMRQLPRRVPVVGNLLQSDTLAWLIGNPGSGKSLAALSMSLSVCLGRDWAGQHVTPGSVFYMAGEGFHELADRADAYLQHHNVEEPNNLHVFTDTVELADPSAVSDLLTAHIQPIPDLRLIVVDTQYVYYNGSEVDAGCAEAYVRGLHTLRRETGACILSLHHVNAAGAPRGSTVFAGSADSIIRLDAVKSRPDRAVLHCYKARGTAPFADVPLAFTAETVGTNGATGEPVTSAVLTATTERVEADATVTGTHRAFELLTALGPCGATSKEWAAACAAVGLRGGSFDRAVAALVKDGTVAKEDGLRGRYTAADQ